MLVALLAIWVFYGRKSDSPPQPAQATAEVQQAYLNFYSALGEAYKQLDAAPVQQDVTSDGLKQQQGIIQQAAQSGYRYQVTADHDLHTVVYSGRILASVDDVMLRHSLPLDILTRAPIGPDQAETIHESTVLVKANGQWLVDSIVAFGAAGPRADLSISYAAVSRGKPLSSALQTEIQGAYAKFWDVSKEALRSTDSSSLQNVETEPVLGKDISLLQQLRQNGQADVLAVQHNYRLAEEDATIVWIYGNHSATPVPDRNSRGPRGNPTLSARSLVERGCVRSGAGAA